MASAESGKNPDLISVKIAYLRNKGSVDPCGNECDLSPLDCGGLDHGLNHDPNTGGTICLSTRKSVIIVNK